MPRNLLILTATIRPPAGALNLARIDPELRMQDYLGAFAFYLDRLQAGTLDQLIFVDNSDSEREAERIGDLARERGLGDRVEVLSFAGLDYPPDYGRSYGEFKLIDRAYELSRTLADRLPDDIVWKVTGRYVVRNLDAIVRRRPTRVDFYCNCRKYPDRYADMYLLAWSDRGYKEFVQGIYHKLRVDKTTLPGEAIFQDLLSAEGDRLKIVPRFNVTPLIKGIRGFNNRKFHSMDETWKYIVRVTLRRMAPWVWI